MFRFWIFYAYSELLEFVVWRIPLKLLNVEYDFTKLIAENQLHAMKIDEIFMIKLSLAQIDVYSLVSWVWDEENWL